MCVCVCINLYIELRRFMCHVTGSVMPLPKSIRLEFVDDPEWGCIVTHTCSSVITFPRRVFTNDSYDSFKHAMQAVMSGSQLAFNTV